MSRNTKTIIIPTGTTTSCSQSGIDAAAAAAFLSPENSLGSVLQPQAGGALTAERRSEIAGGATAQLFTRLFRSHLFKFRTFPSLRFLHLYTIFPHGAKTRSTFPQQHRIPPSLRQIDLISVEHGGLAFDASSGR